MNNKIITIIIFILIGIMLIASVISGVYKRNESTKNYETAEANCIDVIIHYR